MEEVSVTNELYDLLKGLFRQHMENACVLLLGTHDTMWQKWETGEKMVKCKGPAMYCILKWFKNHCFWFSLLQMDSDSKIKKGIFNLDPTIVTVRKLLLKNKAKNMILESSPKASGMYKIELHRAG